MITLYTCMYAHCKLCVQPGLGTATFVLHLHYCMWWVLCRLCASSFFVFAPLPHVQLPTANVAPFSVAV